MNKLMQKFLINLTDKMRTACYDFIKLHLKDEENMEEVINLILSAHISSLGQMLNDINHNDEDRLKQSNEFFNKLIVAIKELPPIYDVKNIEQEPTQGTH